LENIPNKILKNILIPPYRNEDILIVGCEHFLIQPDMKDPYWKKYSNEHNHIGCYTIDQDLSTNSDIDDVYGGRVFKHLPDNFFRETKRLLKEGWF
jgi:hypothetical protein